MKTIILSYRGYLTESKLIQLFKNLEKQTNNIKVETNISISDEYKRYKGDIIINNYYLIEFDSYQHYTKSSIFERDSIKDTLWELQNKKVIRLPYFVQLTDEAFNYYFKDMIKSLNLNIKINSDYQHGFIDKKAVLPADFCSLGERRFISEINNLPENIASEIVNSMLVQLIITNKTIQEIYSLNMREISPFNDTINNLRETNPNIIEDFDIYFYLKTGKGRLK